VRAIAVMLLIGRGGGGAIEQDSRLQRQSMASRPQAAGRIRQRVGARHFVDKPCKAPMRLNWFAVHALLVASSKQPAS
jgi:hypothetical protein